MTTREFPKAVKPYLRYQVGESEIRKALMPVYEEGRSGKLIKHCESPENVSVFRLRGFGSTLKDAEKMAGV